MTRQTIQHHLGLLLHSIECKNHGEQDSPECSFPNCKMMNDILNNTKDGMQIKFMVPSTSKADVNSIGNAQSNVTETPANMPTPLRNNCDWQTEWQQSVSNDLRNDSVHKVFQAIYPTPDRAAMLNKRLCNVVTFAKKVEGDVFDMAQSRAQYDCLLADKIVSIRNEFKQKIQKRKEQHIQAQTVLKRPAGDSTVTKDKQFQAIDAAKTKDWHNSMTIDLRNHLVYTLIQAILPTFNATDIHDTRMTDLVEYAKTVEYDIYKTAGSRSEYYRSVLEIVVKVQEELEAKRQVR